MAIETQPRNHDESRGMTDSQAVKGFRRPLLAIAIAALAAVLGLTACGEKSEDGSAEREPLTLTLDFYPNPDHAGIYMAERLGYFRDAGLDVTIQTPSDPAAPIKLVAAGQTDLAISYEPEVVLAARKGSTWSRSAALVDRPLTSMIWLKESKIGGIADLRGKTIATAGIPYQDAYLETILARADLSPYDVKTVNVGYGLLPAIVGGRAEAMLGGFRNVEGVDLRLRGMSPVVTPVDALGVPTYDELVLVAQGETARGGRQGRSGSSWRRCRAVRPPRSKAPAPRSKRCWRRTPTSTRS